MALHRLARALGVLHDTLMQTGVLDVLGPLRPYAAGQRPAMPKLMQTYAGLVAEQAKFGEPERSLLHAMRLDLLMDAGWWANLISAMTRSSMPEELASDLSALCARIEIALEGFSTLAALIDSASVDAAAAAKAGRLALTIADREGEPANVRRVASALEAVSQLWSVAEDLTGHWGSLLLVATETGADTVLHFDGPAEPMAELRSLLAAVAEQTARLGNVPADQHPLLVPPMLPVMDWIARGTRADAQRVRSTLEKGVRRLIEAGCSLRNPPPPSPEAASAPPASAQPLLIAPATLAWSEQDAAELAAVIAEERRQLEANDPARRLWTGTRPRT